MKAYGDAWARATKEAAEKKIKIAVGDKAWEALWASYLKDLPIVKSRLK